MLLRATRMIERKVNHKSLPSNQPAATLAQLDHFEQLVAFENVESPWFLRGSFACLRWLMVLENDSSSLYCHRVALSSQTTRVAKIGLLLGDRWR